MIRRRLLLPKMALAAFALSVPLGLNGYFVYLADLALAYAILAIGFTFVLGWAGQMAFANVTFFGFGAYASGVAAARLGVPVEGAMLIGTAAGFLLGVAFGALVVRLRRYYLAIATMASTFILDYVYRHLDELTGGVRGLSIPTPRFWLLGGEKVASPYGQYYVGLVFLVVAVVVSVWLRKSSVGREWQVVRADERVATALGINVYASKLKAFALAAAVMSAAGAWLGCLLGQIFPESFLMNELLFQFLIVVIGGLGSVNGAITGAILLVIVRQYLQGFVGLSEILFGLLLLVSVLALQKGIYGTLAAKYHQLREGFV